MAVALLVQKSTTDPEIEGSNSATTWHQEKMADKELLVIVLSVVVALFVINQLLIQKLSV
jgi:hypothetical protein